MLRVISASFPVLDLPTLQISDVACLCEMLTVGYESNLQGYND
jgi:hypothetical protein